jgi:TetR/AcrR family tetracycline transcriptional repressor
MALDREQVIKTALRLMDEVGLEGLSLRRLAKELGVQAPALYWHFANKQELIEEMAEMMTVAELPEPRPIAPGERWEDWLKLRARASRAVLVRRRDAALLAASTKPRGMQFAQIELQLAELVKVGFTPADAARALFTIGNFVAGFALEEQVERRHDDGAQPPDPERVEEWLASLGDYPNLAAAIREIGNAQNDATFEYGLETMVEGLRSRLARPDR